MEPARPERQSVGVGSYLAVHAEPDGASPAPAQWGLAPGAVVVQRPAGMVVFPAQHRRLVVGHRLGAHHREPRHGARSLPNPEG
jgi:hypothetical protein